MVLSLLLLSSVGERAVVAAFNDDDDDDDTMDCCSLGAGNSDDDFLDTVLATEIPGDVNAEALAMIAMKATAVGNFMISIFSLSIKSGQKTSDVPAFF